MLDMFDGQTVFIIMTFVTVVMLMQGLVVPVFGESAKARKKLQQRLDKARDRLAAGRAAGEEDKILEALEATVSRLEEKLAASDSTAQEPG